MRKIRNGTSALRRTAQEIKRYRQIMRVGPVAIGVVTMLLVVVYIVSILYDNYGSFTASVNKFDKVNYALTLYETRDFKNPTSRLNCKAAEEITNINKDTLPNDLDSWDGEHNGKNYVAYSFYVKNAGQSTVDFEYTVSIKSTTMGIEKAVRVRLYVDGEATDYAAPRSDTYGPEDGTTPFLTENIVARGEVTGFEVDQATKFTVVIWLEGDDADCVDEILGGEFKIDMNMEILGLAGDE